MSDSDDDMPLVARRRPQGEAAPAQAAVKPPAPSAAPVQQETNARTPGDAVPAKPEAVAQQTVQAAPAAQAKPVVQPAAQPPAVKQEASSDSSEDSDDDVPLAARSKPTGECCYIRHRLQRVLLLAPPICRIHVRRH